MINSRVRLKTPLGYIQLRVLVIMGICLAILFILLNGWNSFTRASHPNLMPDQGLGKFGLDDEATVSAGKNFTFAIMLDAGSTGSRIHVYRFIYKVKDNMFALDDELFLFIKPGLSSHADDPVKAAHSIQGLLDQAKDYVPHQKWHQTPIALKATAGLRLLPGEKAEEILKKVRELIKGYPFKPVKDFVTIMDGKDEGLYSWFTLNYLSEAINHPEKTMGMLDLGGGSVQITFLPSDQATLETAPKDYLTSTTVMGKPVQLYIHSYLGLGLMSARMQIIKRDPESKVSDKVLVSVCLPPGYTNKWKHQGVEYTIKGKETSGYDQCLDIVKKVLVDNKVSAPVEIKSKPFYTISYFYDRAVDSGIKREEDDDLEEDIHIQNFFDKAEHFCKEHNEDKAFLCMDLTYISSLLHYGLGFDKTNLIVLKKKIRGIETAWTLGAAYQLL